MGYVLGRLGRAVPLLLGLSVLVFGLIHLAPGGPLSVYLTNPNARPEDIERLSRALGLDRPLHEQYWSWLTAFVRGDWGYSYVDGRSAFERVVERIPATVELMATAFALGAFLSIGGGALCGTAGRSVDRVLSTTSFVGISAPTFWVGLILQLVFAVELKWLPSAGRRSPGGGGSLSYLVLPATTLAFFYASSWLRYVRASLGEALGSTFVRTSAARGFSTARVVLRHALPNALLPLVTVMALDLAVLFSGAVVTETVFAWPGMGSLLVESVYRRDYTVLMGILMSGSVLVVAANLAVDVAYGWLDPRVRITSRELPA